MTWPAYRNRCTELPADTSDELWIRDEPSGTLTVVSAPTHAVVADDFYRAALAGRCHAAVSAGEGVLAIHAENGTFRYALDSYDLESDCWTAHRI